MTPISDHKMATFNITDMNHEQKEFKNNITPEISKYFNNGDHVKMRVALKETNWNQVLCDVQNIEKANKNFTRVLIDAAKKANICLYNRTWRQS